MGESHFIKNSIGEGWQIGEFSPIWQKLTKRERQKLIKVIARISEASYRRGAQQLLCFKVNDSFLDGKIKQEIMYGKLRFLVTLDKSPCHDGTMTEISSRERLEMNYGSTLRALGFLI